MPRALHFLHPWALAALPLMWALALWLARRRARTGAWPRVVDADLLALLRLEGSGAPARSPWPLIGALWTLGVVALAGPSWQRQVTAAYRLPAAWVLAVQLSPSMEATDLLPNRAAQARFAVDNLLAAAHDARVGLVAFAGEAYTVAPLTADGATVRNLARALSPQLMPEHGARLAPALGAAARLLHAWAGNDRQVIVLMDSVHDPARAIQAAARLRRAGITVNVVGVGTLAGAPTPLATGGFQSGADHKVLISRLHPAVLERIAEAGGGEFVRLNQLPQLIAALHADGLRGITAAHAAPQVHLSSWLNDGVWLLPLIVLLGALLARRGWT
ncbi:MAG: vWA domain-containing protein [Steroidobacteraceae bacterium]